MEMDVKTIVGVNVRQGPSISFDIIDTIESGTILKTKEYMRDAGGTGWFKLDDNKWICAKFVTSDFKEETKVKARKMTTSSKSTKSSGWSNIGSKVNTSSITGKILNDAKNIFVNGSATNINGGLFSGISNLFGVDGVSAGDVLLKKRLFGAPFQFIESTDVRPTSGTDSELGMFFQNSIMAEAPILSLLPGRPDYLANLTQEGKRDLTSSLIGMVEGGGDTLSQLTSEALDLKKLDTKYFEFIPQHMQYMQYVNLLCRMGAIYMGIGDMTVPGTSTPYKDFNWKDYTMANVYAQKVTSNFITEGLDSLNGSVSELGQLLSKTTDKATGKESTAVKDVEEILAPYNMIPYYIDFYITPSISFNESFSNSTGESVLSSAVGKASNFQKEFMFLLSASGYNPSAVAKNVDGLTDAWKLEAEKILGSGSGSKLIERLVTGATSVISGSNIVFPEVWQDSNFDRSYQFEIKLCTPYGTRESIFLEILVPLFHLLAFTLPCQSTVNSFSSPFIVRSVLPGFFSSEMGIVQDMTINKGGSGDSWTVDGLPTEVTVNLSIKDLYNSLYMSKVGTPNDIYNFIWNTGLVDYIGVQCGINMKKSEYAKKLDVIKSIAGNYFDDLLVNTQESIKEMIARNTIRIFAGK